MALLKSIGCPATRDTAISMIADLDGDGNGNVEYPEFLEVMVHDSDERNDAWQCVIDTLCQDPDFNKRRDEARKHVKTALLSSRIRPESKKRCTLDALVALSITYFYVIILLENVGKCAFTYDTWKIGPEVFCTLVFWLDSFFIMNTAVTHELGVRLLTDRKSIMRKYYKSGQMLCDLVSAFPLDLVFPVWPVSRILRHLRMVKMTRFSSLFFIENTGLMSPQLVVFYFRVVPLFLNAIYCVFVLHTFAVIWLFLQPDDYSYLNSLYYILYTLTTVGYGDIDVDGIAVKVYACFLLVVGACLNGLTIGYLTAFIMRSDISGDKVDKMRQTLAVLRHFQVPSSLQEEILSYQYHVLDHNLGVAYTDVIAGLPPAMQQQVSLYMRVRLVNQVPMFTVCELSVQIALAQSLKNIVVPPEEYIMVAGEEGSEMFFLSHGFCDVLASNGYLLATITKGGFFGEVALLVETERHTNVKALTFCDLFILERREFNLILDRFPSFASHIHDEIELQAGGEAKTETTALLAMDETEPPTPEHIFPDAPMLDDDEIKTEPSDTIVGELKANTGENQNNSDLFERGNSNSGVSLTGAPKRRTSGPAGGAGVDVMSKLKQMRHKTSMASPNPLTMPVTPTNGDIGSDNDPVTPQRVSRAKSKSDDDFETQSFHSRKSRVMSRCGDDDDDDDEDRDKALTSFKSFRRQQQSGLQSGRSVQLSRSNSMKGRSDSGGGDAKMLRQLYETTQILRYSVDGLLVWHPHTETLSLTF